MGCTRTESVMRTMWVHGAWPPRTVFKTTMRWPTSLVSRHIAGRHCKSYLCAGSPHVYDHQSERNYTQWCKCTQSQRNVVSYK